MAELWSVVVEVPRAAGDAFSAAFSDLVDTFSCFESDGGGVWRFEAIFEGEPDRAAVAARLGEAAIATGIASPRPAVEQLATRDWLAENRRQFPPIAAGRFLIHGSYFEGPVPPGRIAVVLDAGLAFGSGTHETTRGCLLAIDGLARGRRFRRPLDLGCGSGILAIAMARRWRVPVAAADVDPVAVRVTRENASRNRVARLVRPRVSDGLRRLASRQHGSYDLVVANILARPLERMAPQLAGACGKGGILILSGLLSEQAAGVLAAYRAQGFALARRVPLGSWATLVLRQSGGRRRAPIEG